MKTGLGISDLVLGYEGAAFTKPISLVIAPGEVVAILGPSGCGKSTLLNTVVGGTKPVSGDLRLGGQSLLELPPEKRGIGIMFQTPMLFPHLNVAANVGFGLSQKGLAKSEIKHRVDELLSLVKLSEYENRDVKELSGGQAQRVALVRALAPNPQILLLDEPLSALDAELRLELAVELKAILKAQSISTIFVTHDRAEAELIADRVIDWQWSLPN